MSAMHAYMFRVLEPVVTHYPETRELYAPGGRLLAEGGAFRFPDLAGALERLAAEGPDWIYRGDGAQRICDWVNERGGTLSREDMAGYRVLERRPVEAYYRGRQVLTNPPPSSGGILIAYALDLLERLGDPPDPADPHGLALLAEVMNEAQRARTPEFHDRPAGGRALRGQVPVRAACRRGQGTHRRVAALARAGSGGRGPRPRLDDAHRRRRRGRQRRERHVLERHAARA